MSHIDVYALWKIISQQRNETEAQFVLFYSLNFLKSVHVQKSIFCHSTLPTTTSNRATYRLDHGCARVAHCATARWRNFSQYCCPLRQNDVWVMCSEHREALACAPTAQTRVHSARGKYIVRQWTSREASFRHSSGWGLKRFPLSSMICAPVL